MADLFQTGDGFGATVAGFGAVHKRIPPRVWSYNRDVEIVHRTIEDEFYDLESFESIKDFHHRVASYQAWYNLVMENSNKDYKSPWQIIRELAPQIDPAIARLPPVMLDWLGPDYIAKEELSLGGTMHLVIPITPYSVLRIVQKKQRQYPPLEQMTF